jgi:hypothetical protein
MDRIDFQLEEFMVAETVGLAFHELDLGVGALQAAGRDRAIIVGQYHPGNYEYHTVPAA